MPKGKCTQCSKVYYGWALRYGYNTCECGGKIEEIRPDSQEQALNKETHEYHDA